MPHSDQLIPVVPNPALDLFEECLLEPLSICALHPVIVTPCPLWCTVYGRTQ